MVCLFRRRDISSSLNSLADSNARELLFIWGGGRCYLGRGGAVVPPPPPPSMHPLGPMLSLCLCVTPFLHPPPPNQPNALFLVLWWLREGGGGGEGHKGCPPPLILVCGGHSLSLSVMLEGGS